MSTVTLTAIDLPGRKYTVTLSKQATVQQFLEKVRTEMKRKGIAYNPSAVRHQGQTFDLDGKLSDYSINSDKVFQIIPHYGYSINRQPINIDVAKQQLEATFQNPRFHEKRSIRKQISNLSTKYAIPNNVESIIKNYAGLKRGGTRRSRRSRRTTRRQRH